MVSKISPRMALARQREDQAFALKAKGATESAIANALGISRSGAHQVLLRAWKRLPSEDAEQLRALSAANLNDAKRIAWQVAGRRHYLFQNGKQVFIEDANGNKVPVEDPAPTLAALDRIVRIDESLRRLYGLDGAVEVSVSIREEQRVEHQETVLARISYMKAVQAGEHGDEAETPVFVDEKAAAKGRQLRGDFYPPA